MGRKRSKSRTATRKSIGARVEVYRNMDVLLLLYEKIGYPFHSDVKLNFDAIGEIVCETGKISGLPICDAELKSGGFKKVLTVWTN